MASLTILGIVPYQIKYLHILQPILIATKFALYIWTAIYFSSPILIKWIIFTITNNGAKTILVHIALHIFILCDYLHKINSEPQVHRVTAKRSRWHLNMQSVAREERNPEILESGSFKMDACFLPCRETLWGARMLVLCSGERHYLPRLSKLTLCSR